VINPNTFSTGNIYPGISGSSKLAANWNPMMDPAETGGYTGQG